MIDPIRGRTDVPRSQSGEARPVKRVQPAPVVHVDLSPEAEAFLEARDGDEESESESESESGSE